MELERWQWQSYKNGLSSSRQFFHYQSSQVIRTVYGMDFDEIWATDRSVYPALRFANLWKAIYQHHSNKSATHYVLTFADGQKFGAESPSWWLSLRWENKIPRNFHTPRQTVIGGCKPSGRALRVYAMQTTLSTLAHYFKSRRYYGPQQKLPIGRSNYERALPKTRSDGLHPQLRSGLAVMFNECLFFFKGNNSLPMMLFFI